MSVRAICVNNVHARERVFTSYAAAIAWVKSLGVSSDGCGCNYQNRTVWYRA